MARTKRKMRYKSESELVAAGLEWRERLGLSDWFITVRLADDDEMTEPDWAGQCEADYINKSAEIKVRRALPISQRPQPHEQVLIHELLHCKFLGLEKSDASIESVYYETAQHALLEDMSKALYCAKYQLPLKYFSEGDE